MPQIDVQCANDHICEVYRHHSQYPETPGCPVCAAPTVQVHLPPRTLHTVPIDPVVIYRAPDGTIRVPPDTVSASTKMYDDLGYTRVELRSFTDVRRFESAFNQQQMSEVNRRVERQQEQHERSESERRSEIRRCLEQGFRMPEYDERGQATGRMTTVRLSAHGRDVMEAAMQRTDAKGGPRARDTGVHLEAFSYDRLNRAPDPRRRGQ